MKTKLMVLLRVIVLAILYFILFSIISAVLIPGSTQQPTAGNETAVFISLLAVSLLNSLVLTFIIRRSRVTGWKLALNVFVIFFGATTLMSQMETAVFLTRLPPGLLPRIVISGLVLALIISPLAVVVLGKRRNDGGTENTARLQMPASQWVIKLSVIALSYVIIYFTFGYFIAWKNPAVRAYYQGTDPEDFFDQMKIVLRDTPWLPLFQFLRGLLWTALAIPVIRMMKGEWWEAALAVALCFAVIMNAQLLIPNPLMPREVRMAHLLETGTSNFLFSWLLVFVLVKWRGKEAANT